MITAETVRGRYFLANDLRGRLATQSATQMPETLYHYTDAEGLLGIITSGTVWATHYAYLNDASEFKYAVGVMKDIVEEVAADAKRDSWEARLRHVMSQSNIAGWADDEQQFVACFSEGGDELSQWRGYGKAIGGYSLGFPSAHLQTIRIRHRPSDRSSSPIIVEFNPCWYDKQAQKALITEGVKLVLRHCAEARLHVDDSALADFLGTILRVVSPCFKDPSFKDEREWRLVVRQRTQNDIHPDQIAMVRFRKGEYSLVPYIIVPVVLEAVLSLSQVVLGPTPLPENARAAAMRLLRPEPEGPQIPGAATARQRIVCTNVINSSIPFRRV